MQPQQNEPADPVVPRPTSSKPDQSQPSAVQPPTTPEQPAASIVPSPITPVIDPAPAVPAQPGPAPVPVQPAPAAAGQTPIQPAVPQAPAPITPLTQADFLAMAKKHRRPKRMIFAVLAVCLLIGAGFLLYSSGLLGGMKTVKYNNGRGQTFSLKFYSQYKIEPLKSNTGAEGVSGGKALIAKKGKDGKAPLSIYIFSTDAEKIANSPESKKAFENNSRCLGKTPVSKTYNAWVGSEVYICNYTTDSDYNYIHYTTFMNKDKLVFALIMQDLDYEGMTTAKQAKTLLKSIGLEVYDQDIDQIVGSIKPQ